MGKAADYNGWLEAIHETLGTGFSVGFQVREYLEEVDKMREDLATAEEAVHNHPEELQTVKEAEAEKWDVERKKLVRNYKQELN